MPNDRDFLLRRADQERALSLKATTPAAARAHRELEASYRAKLDHRSTAPKAQTLTAAQRDSGPPTTAAD